MNVLINTPLLKTTAIKEDFDNKILLAFLAAIITLVVLGLLFFDLIKTRSTTLPDTTNQLDSPRTELYN